MRLSLLVSLAALLSLLGATLVPPAPGTFSGTVVDAETGEPLAGANALLLGTALGAATDEDGRFEITGAPDGDYDLRVSLAGFDAQTVAAALPQRAPVHLALHKQAELERAEPIAALPRASPADRPRSKPSSAPTLYPGDGTGTLAGLVTDNFGDPLPGANVQLEGTALGAATDIDGRYRIIGVPAGTYAVTVSFVGFDSCHDLRRDHRRRRDARAERRAQRRGDAGVHHRRVQPSHF